jgi:hypothetical protein
LFQFGSAYLRLRRQLALLPKGTSGTADSSAFAKGLARMQHFLLLAIVLVVVAVASNLLSLSDSSEWDTSKAPKIPTLDGEYVFPPSQALTFVYMALSMWWCWVPLREVIVSFYRASRTNVPLRALRLLWLRRRGSWLRRKRIRSDSRADSPRRPV